MGKGFKSPLGHQGQAVFQSVTVHRGTQIALESGLVRHVQPLGSGKFKVRFRHGISPRTGKPLQTSETFDRKRDAEQFAVWLDALGTQGALDRLYDAEQKARTPTLTQVAAEHIDHLEGAGAGHKLKMQRLWERTWGPRIGDLPADEVSRDRLVKALGDLAANGRAPGRGYSEKSLKNQRGLLHGVLERAVRDGHLTRHPGLRLKLPQVTVSLDSDDDEAAEMVFLQLDEFGALYWATTDHYQPLVRFLAGTGCRWGEAVALRVGDVQLDTTAPTVRVRRALKWSPDGRHTIGPPKTKKSRRSVTIGPELVDDLTPLVVGRPARDLVFTAPRGGMIQHRTFWSDHWRPAIWRAQHCAEHTDPDCRCGTAHPKRCKVHDAPPPTCGCAGVLTQSPRIHDLRHSHASWLLNAGYPIHVVQARLGHESIQTTVDTYGHLLPDVAVAAASAANLAFPARPAIG